jgi:hypothetical protein
MYSAKVHFRLALFQTEQPCDQFGDHPEKIEKTTHKRETNSKNEHLTFSKKAILKRNAQQ